MFQNFTEIICEWSTGLNKKLAVLLPSVNEIPILILLNLSVPTSQSSFCHFTICWNGHFTPAMWKFPIWKFNFLDCLQVRQLLSKQMIISTGHPACFERNTPTPLSMEWCCREVEFKSKAIKCCDTLTFNLVLLPVSAHNYPVIECYSFLDLFV